MNTRFLIAGLSFVIILLSGFWLSRTGKPYNAAILSVHKLISLAALVYFVVTIFQINKVAPLSTIEIVLSAMTVVFFVALMVSGGLLSAAKTLPGIIKIGHKIMPYLVILSTAASLYLFLIRKQ